MVCAGASARRSSRARPMPRNSRRLWTTPARRRSSSATASPAPSLRAAGIISAPATAKGWGVSGNVPAGAIQQLIDSLPGLQTVTNPQPSSGGADPESLAQIRANAPAVCAPSAAPSAPRIMPALALSYPGIVKAGARWVRRDADHPAGHPAALRSADGGNRQSGAAERADQ